MKRGWSAEKLRAEVFSIALVPAIDPLESLKLSMLIFKYNIDLNVKQDKLVLQKANLKVDVLASEK